MNSLLTPAAEVYLRDWIVTLSIGGLICAILGAFCGWIIWRKSRSFAETVEERNRTALADCERTRDEVSRIKSELAFGS